MMRYGKVKKRKVDKKMANDEFEGMFIEEGEEYTRCPNCQDGMYLASTGGCAYCGWVA